jgi:glycosyltransferase involved in cell wall biosynthesis
MKILIVTSNYPRWPNDTTTPFVHNFARQLVKNGHKVRVLAPHYSGAKTKELFDGIEVRRFRYLLPLKAQTVCYQGGALGNLSKNPLNKLKLPILVMCELLAVMKELALWKPDIVNSHWLLPQGFVAALACKLFRTKHIATVHGGDVFALNSPLMRKLKTFAIKNSALVTVNSSVTEKVTRELAPDSPTPLLRLPTGILPLPELNKQKIADLRDKLKQSKGEKLILFVGRLSEEKGVREAIKATHQLLAEHKKVRLIIVGEGHEKETFQALVKELDIADQVDFLGWVPNQDVYYYFAASDVFVGPSKQAKNGQIEAQGLTFVEAMLAGCPVIGSNSGGIPDAVIPGKTGWLIEPGDYRSLLNCIDDVFISSNGPILQQAKTFAEENYLISKTAKKFINTIELIKNSNIKKYTDVN